MGYLILVSSPTNSWLWPSNMWTYAKKRWCPNSFFASTIDINRQACGFSWACHGFVLYTSCIDHVPNNPPNKNHMPHGAGIHTWLGWRKEWLLTCRFVWTLLTHVFFFPAATLSAMQAAGICNWPGFWPRATFCTIPRWLPTRFAFELSIWRSGTNPKRLKRSSWFTRHCWYTSIFTATLCGEVPSFVPQISSFWSVISKNCGTSYFFRHVQ